MQASGNAIAYRFNDGLYLNLTERCPTDCAFCLKKPSGRRFRGVGLGLSAEPEVETLWSEVQRSAGQVSELVFCGFGEPTYRMPEVFDLCGRMRRDFPSIRRRLNTIGLGSMIWGRDLPAMLRPALDAVSVSLNTALPAQWRRMHRPNSAFEQDGFWEVLEFIRGCSKAGLETTVTAVELPGVELEAVSKLARRLGAGFRARPRL